jgi:hypothetical protein
VPIRIACEHAMAISLMKGLENCTFTKSISWNSVMMYNRKTKCKSDMQWAYTVIMNSS